MAAIPCKQGVMCITMESSTCTSSRTRARYSTGAARTIVKTLFTLDDVAGDPRFPR
jgi:hypothetical protein